MPYTYRRRNIYYPDRIEKYYKDPDWKPYIETEKDAEGNTWVALIDISPSKIGRSHQGYEEIQSAPKGGK